MKKLLIVGNKNIDMKNIYNDYYPIFWNIPHKSTWFFENNILLNYNNTQIEFSNSSDVLCSCYDHIYIVGKLNWLQKLKLHHKTSHRIHKINYNNVKITVGYLN